MTGLEEIVLPSFPALVNEMNGDDTEKCFDMMLYLISCEMCTLHLYC